MKLVRNQILDVGMRVLADHPNGIKWAELIRAVAATTPDTPYNNVYGAVHKLVTTKPAEIIKVARGTYQLAKFVSTETAVADAQENPTVTTPVKADIPGADPVAEQDFYASFAKWLEENDEVTIASALGGAGLGGKWGTPDVIGVLKPRAQDIFKFEPQIVTAEIKAVPGQTVIAFGQAVAYRLFSHKSYIVVPKTTSPDEISRLKSLCSLHGVGLVTFALNKVDPDYIVLVQPAVATPDMFYVNRVLEQLKKTEPGLLNKLF